MYLYPRAHTGAGVYLPTDKYEEMQEELKRLGEAEAVLQVRRLCC